MIIRTLFSAGLFGLIGYGLAASKCTLQVCSSEANPLWSTLVGVAVGVMISLGSRR